MNATNALPPQPESGRVVWITGLSGAGKSTLSRRVAERFRELKYATLLLDGDAMREVVSDPHVAHDRESRLTHAMRICRMARLASDQGLTVVVATMSLFKEVYEWNRQHLYGYCEVFLQVDLETLRRRDARGLYSKADRGEARHVVGIHVPYDEPQSPHLTLRNEGSQRDLESLVHPVIEAALRSPLLSQTETQVHA